MELLTRPSQPSGHAMRVDSEYLRSWRDLRRREFLLWFFVLSYVPSIAIIIVLMDRFGSDVLDRIATFFPLPGWSDLPAQVFIVRISAVRVVTNFSPRAMGWRPATSMRRCRPPSAGKRQVTSTRREATGTSRWSFDWPRSTGRT